MLGVYKFNDYIHCLETVKEQCKDDIVLDIRMYEQTWSSTALGFGGIGGQSITSAPTIVVITDRSLKVFFGGGLAYIVKHGKKASYKEEAIKDLIEGCNAAPCWESNKYMWSKEEQYEE